MSQLIVVGFKKDMYRASQVLNQLQAMNDDWVVDLHDAVAAYRDQNGKLRVDQSYQMTTREGAGWGGLMGSLIGLTLAIPFTGGATAPAAGALAAGALAGGALGAGAGAIDASWWKDEFGIPDDFVNQVVPGQEEGNCELLLRHGAGALATTPQSVAETLRAAFADGGRGWAGWRAALGPLSRPDAAPRITFGKITEADGRCTMPVSIHAHHALADGLHVAQFVDKFQHALDTPDSDPS